MDWQVCETIFFRLDWVFHLLGCPHNVSFHWRNMYDEIKVFVKVCHLCRRMNPKFVKSHTKLHPVPVRAQVRHKMSYIAGLLWVEL